MKASIIIPIRNQIERLNVTLKAFKKQNIPLDSFEVIIVDDGSDEPIINQIQLQEYSFQTTIITQDKKGRSVARNQGAKKAISELLIFCDADRFPGKQFVSSHISAHSRWGDALVIGQIKELYISNIAACVTKISDDPDCLLRRAKIPPYPRIVGNLYNEEGITDSSLRWISTFSGNMSISKTVFKAADGFNDEFTEWGFEHFELGYRVFKNAVPFYCEFGAVNYHIAHKRDVDKLIEYISKSVEILKKNHGDSEVFDDLFLFMNGKSSLQHIEKNKNSNWLNNVQQELYFTIGALI